MHTNLLGVPSRCFSSTSPSPIPVAWTFSFAVLASSMALIHRRPSAHHGTPAPAKRCQRTRVQAHPGAALGSRCYPWLACHRREYAVADTAATTTSAAALSVASTQRCEQCTERQPGSGTASTDSNSCSGRSNSGLACTARIPRTLCLQRARDCGTRLACNSDRSKPDQSGENATTA